MSERTYRPLEGYIETSVDQDSGAPIWYFTHGHVDKAEFLAELKADDYRLAETVTVDSIEHAYARNVPTGEKGWHSINLCKGPGRGAYKITYIDLWKPAKKPVEGKK